MNNKVKMSGTYANGCIIKDNMQLAVDETLTYGPTSSTGFWAGITPPAGGYTVYLTKGSQGPSIYTTSDIVASTKQISGNNSITTVAQALDWYYGQTDKIVVNRNFPNLRTSGLQIAFDSAFPPCFPRTGTSCYDMSPTHHQLITNGTWVTDGIYLANDAPNPGANSKNWVVNVNTTIQTISIWIKTINQNGSIYTLFDSGTSQLKLDNTAVGSAYNGSILFRNGINIGTVSGINNIVSQNGNWENYIIVLSSPITASKLSLFCNITSQNGTEGWIGEVYTWNEELNDGEIINHFNSFCSKYGVC